MESSIQVAVIAGTALVTSGAIGGLISAFSARRAALSAERGERIAQEAKEQIGVVKISLDGRLAELITLTREMAYAAGVKDQRIKGEVLAAAVKEARRPPAPDVVADWGGPEQR